MSICLIAICGCEKDDMTVTTGIIGTVEYGQGDCMPGPDQIREYNNYTGKMYFIVKEDLDNLGDGDYEILKSSSISVKIRNGKLSMELPPETYLVEPEDDYLYSTENTIIIKSGEVVHKDFKFFKCTSF